MIKAIGVLNSRPDQQFKQRLDPESKQIKLSRRHGPVVKALSEHPEKCLKRKWS
jgi:hypothetical protein